MRLLLLLAVLASPAFAAERPPNVVIIFADDGLYAVSLLRTLAMMDPAAAERFDRLRYHRPDNEDLVVVIAAGRFGCNQLPSGLVSEGQSRTAIR